MSNAVAQQGNVLPALPDHIRSAVEKLGKNETVGSGLGSNFVAPPRLSIEGGKFSVVVDGVSQRLTKQDEDGNKVAVTMLKGVVLGANSGKYKVYYGSKYDKDGEATAPLCYSYDGEKPSPFAQEKQCETCAACPHNVWGSSITESGKKTRSCSDNKILAFLPLHSVVKKAEAGTVEGQVYSVKVTPSALSRNRQERNEHPENNTSLKEYIDLLNNYPIDGDSVEVPVSAVATTLFFELEAEYPLLRFRLGRFLKADEIEYVMTRKDGDDVRAIVEDQREMAALTAPAKPAALPAPKKAKNEDDDESGFEMPTLGKPAAKPADEPASSPRTRRTGRNAKSDVPAAGVTKQAAAPTQEVKKTTPNIDAELAALDGMFPDVE